MNIVCKVSNTNTNNTNLTSRKDTFGANEHTRVVQPLTMADLSVVESVRNRDISKQGWSHTPKVPVSRRSTAASSPAASPRDDFSPIGAFTPDDLIAVHNSITQSTIPSTSTASNVSHSHSSLKSALSITPADIAALSKGAGSPDERLNNSIILLSQEQFQNELVLIKLIGTGACGSVHEVRVCLSLTAVTPFTAHHAFTPRPSGNLERVAVCRENPPSIQADLKNSGQHVPPGGRADVDDRQPRGRAEDPCCLPVPTEPVHRDRARDQRISARPHPRTTPQARVCFLPVDCRRTTDRRRQRHAHSLAHSLFPPTNPGTRPFWTSASRSRTPSPSATPRTWCTETSRRTTSCSTRTTTSSSPTLVWRWTWTRSAWA